MNKIYICADTHGLMDIKKIKNLIATKQPDYSDYIIICGDVGIGWNDEITKELIEFYESLGTNILFIDGNHENFIKLRNYTFENWNGGVSYKISEHIRFLERSQIFNICGKNFLTLGGGNSHDIEHRVEGVDWFKEENILKADVDMAIERVRMRNLKIDYILTHTPNQIFADLLYDRFTQCGEDFPPFLQNKYINNESGKRLNIVANKIKFKKWFCGHWHIDESIGKYVMLYENIVEILL